MVRPINSLLHFGMLEINVLSKILVIFFNVAFAVNNLLSFGLSLLLIYRMLRNWGYSSGIRNS